MESGKELLLKAFRYITDDYGRRTVATSVPSLLWSAFYASATALAAAISHSLWLALMAGFYAVTIFMTLSVLYKSGKALISSQKNLSSKNYRSFSFQLLIFDIALGIVVLIFHLKGIHKTYPGFTIYITAIYVLIRLVLSAVNMVKARRSKSFAAISIRKIDTVKSLVNLLVLQSALLTTFGNPRSDFTRKVNSYAGLAAFIIIFFLSIGGFITAARIKEE